MRDSVTPKQVARAIGVSESSVKRWCDRGALPAIRTAGGHRRLPINGVVQFLRTREHPIVQPALLGLPSVSRTTDRPIERARERFTEALAAGDEARGRQVILDLYLAGHSVADIGDRVIAPTFGALGLAWQHGEIEVYQERRGCEICNHVLFELKSLLPTLPEDGPRAIGGTLTGDPYTLPNAMAEIALREVGWLAQSLGCGNPAETLAAALRESQPRLFWLSVSAVGSVPSFLDQYDALHEAAASAGVPIVVGGRALTADVRTEMSYAAFCDNLRHLQAFARTLARTS
jgi:excisionase family DNA binding protein